MIPDDLPELRSRLDAAIKEHGMVDYREAILQAAEPCVLYFATHEPLRLESEWLARLPDHWPRFGLHAPPEFNELVMNRLPIGGSRLGGLPDLPPEVEWPAYAGKRLPLIAQINLSEVSRWSGYPLPASGWLCVFFAFEAGLDREPCIALHFDGPSSSLRRAPWPLEEEVHRDWGDIAVYDPLPLRLALSLTGNFTDLVGQSIPDDDEHSDQLLDLQDSFYESSFYDDRQPVIELLGTMSFIGASPSQVAQDQGRHEDDWINLLEVQSAGTMMWSDAGYLNILIRSSSIRENDFSDVLAAVNSA